MKTSLIDKLITKTIIGEDPDQLISEAISTDGGGEVDINLDNPRVDTIPPEENISIVLGKISKAIKVIPLPVSEIEGYMHDLGINDIATLTKMGYNASQYSSLADFIEDKAGFLMKILNMVIPMANKKFS